MDKRQIPENNFHAMAELNSKIKELALIGFDYTLLRNRLRLSPIETILRFAKTVLTNDPTMKFLFYRLHNSIKSGTIYASADYACYMGCIAFSTQNKEFLQLVYSL